MSEVLSDNLSFPSPWTVILQLGEKCNTLWILGKRVANGCVNQMCSNILSRRQHCLSVPFQMSKWTTLFYQVLNSILHGVDFTSTVSKRDGILGGHSSGLHTQVHDKSSMRSFNLAGGGGGHRKLRTEVPKSSMFSNLGGVFYVDKNTLFGVILTTDSSHWAKLCITDAQYLKHY